MIIMTNHSFNEDNISKEKEGLILVGKMASGIIHDVNNILTSIQGYITLLSLRQKDKDCLEYINVIQKSLLDGKEVVKRVKKLNINEDDKLHIINIKEQIEYAIMMTKPMWHNDAMVSGKTIKVEYKGEDELYIIGNEYELREAIVNLIFNAVDAIHKRGVINICSYGREGKAIIKITDNGCGMSEETKLRLFEPFYSTKGVKGNGLGLNIVFTTVEKINGNIDVYTCMGKGSTFELSFPMAEKPCNESDECANEEIFNEVNVLIVDDQAEIGNVIGQMLMLIGNIKAKAFTSCNDALELLKNEKFDIVIADMIMPEMNGKEFIAEAKAKSSNNTKFVLMTGYISNVKEEKNDQIDYILNKPFTLDELKHMIIYLQKKRMADVV